MHTHHLGVAESLRGVARIGLVWAARVMGVGVWAPRHGVRMMGIADVWSWGWIGLSRLECVKATPRRSRLMPRHWGYETMKKQRLEDNLKKREERTPRICVGSHLVHVPG
ncbi:hypothetical protein PIB30_099896, partial [Stylosanthes scabra]|nr:hypothetical protein [Stylosanthes scabra]